ncbi:RagB/SusD family nutrient uptake outer membrane protein [Chryseolinea sp. T2]|uniref:RagB/SusD family nutrient uptake outer membrane protein n=1 Tax=Chryseolinea sp. T2 TaxID=3129255 RepID=UPI0030775204
MKRIFLIASVFLFVTIRCSDEFLVRPPQNQITTESFWKTDQDAILAVNSIYDALQTDMGYRLGGLMFGDIAGDDMTCFDGEWFVPHDNFTVNASNTQVKRAWRAWWAGVARANAVLDHVPSINMDETLKQRLLNEAKFLRGVSYFNIVTIWGDAPLMIHEVDNADIFTVTRQPQSEIWAQIEQDFHDAEALPVSIPGEEGRATKGAAKAFLSRTYLYQSKFQQAADKAKEVIDLGVYKLHDDYIRNYQTQYENGVESVFEVQFVAGTGGWGNNEGNWVPSYSGPSGSSYVASGAWGIVVPAANSKNIYEANDKRRAVNLFEAGSVYNKIAYDPKWSQTGLSLAKYIVGDPPVSTEGPVDAERNMPIIRYAEVLLIYAEALNELNHTATAEPFLNQVRHRAGLDDISGLTQQSFRDAIMQERRVEFFGEGHRFFDLRRWGKVKEYVHDLAGKENYIEPKNLYFPIPQDERDLNPGLEQNTGY